MHLTTESLIELIDGDPSDGTRRHLETHLAACDRCREREREIRRVLEALTADRLVEPSTESVAAILRALRRGRAVDLPRWAEGLPERMARMVFDSFTNPRQAFAGARAVSVARRLRFEVDQLELDALIEVEGDGQRLTGQVLSLGTSPRPVGGAPFFVLGAGGVVTDGRTNDHGEIMVEAAPAGEFEIRVGVEGRVYVFDVSDPNASTPDG